MQPLTPQPGNSRRAPNRMPSSPPSLLVYPDLTPTTLGLSWGNGPNEVLDLYIDPQPGSGRWVLVWLHGGAGTHGDLRQISMGGNGLGSALLHYLHTHPNKPAPVDVLAVNYEKAAWLGGTPCTHLPAYVPTDFPTLWPSNVDRLSQLWGWIAWNAVSRGWDEDHLNLGGVSHGGVLAMLARLVNGAPVRSLVIESPLSSYEDPNIWYQVGRGMAGVSLVTDQTSWEAVAAIDKQGMSAILQLSANYVPMFLANARVGNGQTPFGSVGDGSNVHDKLQCDRLVDALEALSLPYEARYYERTVLDTPRLGQQIAAAAHAHMVASQV